jgi:hypothetical protein
MRAHQQNLTTLKIFTFLCMLPIMTLGVGTSATEDDVSIIYANLWFA